LIDAATFASSFAAFWRSHAPTCEIFVRRLNLDGYERFNVPIASEVAPQRRSLIAEYAFSLFSVRPDVDIQILDADERQRTLELAKEQALVRMSKFGEQGLDLSTNFSDEEDADVGRLSDSLRRFFLSRGKRIVTRPLFKGCGYIDESEGDVLSGDAVYEVKAVDRLFRSIDIHQLLTYAALNSMSAQYSLTKLGVFNPRRGIFFEFELDEISREISGRAATELLWTIANSISSGEISR
jgi:hypothetical protein